MIREELKKIWRPRNFIVFAILCVFFWVVTLEYNVKFFPNGAENQAAFPIQAEWVEKYGTTLEDDEIDEILAGYDALCKELETTFDGEPLFKQYQITTYEEFKTFFDNSWDDDKQLEDADMMQNYLMEQEHFWDIYAIDNCLRFVEEFQTEGAAFFDYMLEGDYTEQEYDNAVRTVIEEEGWRNILPYEIPQVTTNYWGGLMALAILSVCIMTVPLLVRDRMYRMRSLQWSSKKGRSIIFAQFGAVVLSAFLLATIYLVIFGAIFATNQTWLFWNCRMYSFDAITPCWGNWTYGTYCIILAAIYYVVSIGSAALAFLLSRFSSNYVSMLLKLIPMYVVLYVMCRNFSFEVFYYSNDLFKLIGIPYIEAIVPMLLLVIGIAAVVLVCKKQKNMELLTD